MDLYNKVSVMLCESQDVKIRYKPTGTVYTVIEDCKVKVSGKWVDALTYTGTHAAFVRLHDDFDKFEVVE